ncbi:hypothetical protein BD310DRAFT_936904 [Dichomitus squalens]|uniref:Uncharacterized protein n=1 Tax=Dichomitus squalens TaxID=114155 RepID=A0A4Q9PIU2_9APHY|nr:hypothetical protein BD310DRAFT_936904 [Dichomitus squalens]
MRRRGAPRWRTKQASDRIRTRGIRRLLPEVSVISARELACKESVHGRGRFGSTRLQVFVSLYHMCLVGLQHRAVTRPR